MFLQIYVKIIKGKFFMAPINSAKKAAQIITETVSSSKVTKTASEIALSAREMEMVPKYLELASLKGADRFNKDQIRSITSNFKSYKTNLSKTDLLKDLLSIGVEKGKPLTPKEMEGFLNATSSMKQFEQRNVLKFLKAAKEKEGVELTADTLKQGYPYEKFKNREIRLYGESDRVRSNPDYMAEENIKKRYETAIKNELLLASNKYYHQSAAAEKLKPSEYITGGRNPEFVRAVSKCSEPEKFLKVIEITGVTPSVIASADDLITALKLGDGNFALVLDLAKGFYPSEVNDIVSILSKEVKAGTRKNLDGYRGKTILNFNYGFPAGESLRSVRKEVLQELGLEGKIIMRPLAKYEDVYSSPYDFAARGRKLSGGNFERGKKK